MRCTKLKFLRKAVHRHPFGLIFVPVLYTLHSCVQSNVKLHLHVYIAIATVICVELCFRQPVYITHEVYEAEISKESSP